MGSTPAPRPGFVARIVDAAVATLSPERALRRNQARARLATQSQPELTRAIRDRNVAALRYEAARFDRLRSKMSSGSADGDLLRDLDSLRQKSQALTRDDAHASAAVRISVENVVGSGINPQATVRPEITGCSESECAEFNTAAEQYWRVWAQRHADANGISDFSDLTRIIYRGRLVDGEALAHRVLMPNERGQGQTAFELIDPARLKDPVRGGLDTREGVEIGPAGEPVAYWILPYHPDDSMFVRRGLAINLPERYARTLGPFANILHVYRRERPGQSRGVPILVPAMSLFDQLHHYMDSELVAARVNSCTAIVVERPLDQSDPDVNPAPADGPHDDGSGEPHFHENTEAGVYQYLNPGEKFNSFSPQRPGTTFDPFVIRILRAIAGSMGISYELIVKDFSSMNYTSSRTKLLEARRGFETEQGMLIATWCRPVWETVIREGVLTGALPFFRQMNGNLNAFLSARWIRPAWGWVDPVKEIEAARMACESNLSTPQAEAARSGSDVEEVLRARGEYYVLARSIEDEKGLEPGTLTTITQPGQQPGQKPSQPQPAPVGGGSDDDDAKDEGDEKDED